jgi:hypothetical protein
MKLIQMYKKIKFIKKGVNCLGKGLGIVIDLSFNTLSDWLSSSRKTSADKRYSHLHLKESVVISNEVEEELRNLIQQAHADYKKFHRETLGYSLDPLNPNDKKDPAYGYPENLDITTLKGYFGEIFAGIVAENYSHFGKKKWKVPAFCFRHHHLAFDKLERLKRSTDHSKSMVGRTGDDCVAFLLDENDSIAKILMCEAKCTNDHDSGMISDAHEKISDKIQITVETSRLIAILRDYDDPESKKWINALRELYFKEEDTYERYDLVSYICGRSPVNKKTWISTIKPHSKYQGQRKLAAVEIHLSNVEELIRKVYNKGD